MYTYEPSLSLDLEEDRVSSPDGGSASFFSGTPSSAASNRELDDPSVVVVSADGVVEIYRHLEVHEDGLTPEARPDEQDDDVSPEARALLPAPNSCPRSGMNIRSRQSPTFGSTKSHVSAPRRTQSFGEDPYQVHLDDYLCACKRCPRALTIQRAFQLYGFALDHPHSDALLRVLRACANYDETIVEVDPILVLHAEKMLEELNFNENETFCLLVASHFQRP